MIRIIARNAHIQDIPAPAKPEPPPKYPHRKPYVPIKDSGYTKWSEPQLAMLKALASREPRPSDATIALVLGRSESAIKSKLAVLKEPA